MSRRSLNINYWRIIILLAVTCALQLPWNVFVDTSFVPYFALCLGGPLVFVVLWTARLRQGDFRVGMSMLIGIGWMVYILIHRLIVEGESYYSSAVLSSIIVFVTSALCFQKTMMTKNTLYSLLITVAIVQVIAVGLQWTGLVDSLSSFFRVTGTFENPNISAMMTALCIPAIIEKLRELTGKPMWKSALILLLLLSVMAIILLRCRTAIIIIVCTVIDFTMRHSKGWAKWMIRVCALLILGGLVVFLYAWKPQSADGRLFIWRNAAEMITNSPLQGVGYGLFEKEYNIRQAEILETLPVEAPQRKHARCVMTAYNEFLEQGIQGGVIGAILFSLFVLSPWLFAKRKNRLHMVWGISILVISMTNLTVKATALWTLICILYGFMASQERSLCPPRSIRTVLACGLLILSCCLVYGSMRHFRAHLVLKQSVTAFQSSPQAAVATMERYRQFAGSSECYLRHYAQALMRIGQIREAKEVLNEAKRWTSNPVVYWNLFKCHRLLGDDERANCYLHYLELQNAPIPRKSPLNRERNKISEVRDAL